MLHTNESSRKLLVSLVEAETNYTRMELVGGDIDRMKKVIDELEEHVYVTMKQSFFDYKTIRFEVTKCIKLMACSDQEWENTPKWKKIMTSRDSPKEELMNRVHTTILNEIDRVSTFYEFEQVKLLSLSYDTIARLRDTVMEDMDLVRDLLDSMECTLSELFEIVIYVRKTVNDIETSLKDYMDRMKIAEDHTFLKFVRMKLSTPGSTFRTLLEHSGLYKAFYMAKFTQDVIEKEMNRAFEMLNVKRQDCEIGAEADEKLNMKGENINSLLEINRLLVITKCLLSAIDDHLPCIHSSCLWHNLNIQYTEYHDTIEMAQHTINFYTDVSLTKDDYIQAKLKEFEEVDNYEEESNRPSSDTLSLWIVILHTTFYIINYYGLYPVAFEQLHNFDSINDSNAAFCIAVTPAVATCLIFYYDWLYPRTGFRKVYAQSFVCLILGNLLYSLASMPAIGNLPVLLVGRALIGAGGVRIITRKYLVIFINDKFRQRYYGISCVLSHIGKALGPGISSLLLLAAPGRGSTQINDENYTVNRGNIFTIFCTGAWVLGFLAFLKLFRGQMKLLKKKTAQMNKQARLEAMRYQSVINKMAGKEIKRIVIESRKRNDGELEKHRKMTPRQLPPSAFGLIANSQEMFIQLHHGTLGIAFRNEMEGLVANSPSPKRCTLVLLSREPSSQTSPSSRYQKAIP